MSFLDKLTSFLKIKIDISKLKDIHLFSDNKVIKIEYHDHRTGNTSTVDSKDLPKLQQLLRGAVKEEDALLLEKRAKSVLDDFRATDQQEEHKKLLEYFRGKIPLPDLEIFRAALYIKKVYERGERIWELKYQIVQRHGIRGRNIVNLCTAGYFTSLIRPLYETMSVQLDFTPDKFIARYDVIVTQYPFAVFVNQHMSYRELKIEVEKKMEINKQYGIKHLNIHGIGEENVLKIQELLKELKDKFTSPPEIDAGRSFITIKIWF